MMRDKTLMRISGAISLTVGVSALLLARWGVLWSVEYRPFVNDMQLYVMRPAMYLFGAGSTLLGLWHLWIRWTTFGYVLGSWAEACRWERTMDKLYASEALAGEPIQTRTIAADLHYLWYLLTHCAIGRHDPNALSYCKGGEDGPRGTQCCDCGIMVSGQNVQPALRALAEEDYRRIEAEMAAEMADEPNTIYVLHPDGFRRPEDARCDKEA